MLDWKIDTQLNRIQKERKRIQKIEESKLPSFYIEYLKQTDEELTTKGFEKIRCKNCGESFSESISTEFSFCDEYDCGIDLCKPCAAKLRDRLTELLKEGD